MDWEKSATLGPTLVALGFILVQHWHQQRDYKRYGHVPKWRQLFQQQLLLTIRTERFFRLVTVVIAATTVRDLLMHLSYRNDFAIFLIAIAFCLVMWRQRRFFQERQQRWQASSNSTSTDQP